MSTVTIKKQRTGTDVSMSLTLTDGGSRVSWKSLSDVYVYMYADEQRVMAGLVDHRISPDDEFTLLAMYGVNEPQYLGVNRVVITCVYMGRTRTYDAPVVEFVQNLADEGTTDVDVISIALQVSDVSTSILDEAIAACIAATAASEAQNATVASAEEERGIAEAGRKSSERGREEAEEERQRAEVRREGRMEEVEEYVENLFETKVDKAELRRSVDALSSNIADLDRRKLDTGNYTDDQERLQDQLAGKADKTYVNTELAKKADASKLSELEDIINGSGYEYSEDVSRTSLIADRWNLIHLTDPIESGRNYKIKNTSTFIDGVELRHSVIFKLLPQGTTDANAQGQRVPTSGVVDDQQTTEFESGYSTDVIAVYLGNGYNYVNAILSDNEPDEEGLIARVDRLEEDVAELEGIVGGKPFVNDKLKVLSAERIPYQFLHSTSKVSQQHFCLGGDEYIIAQNTWPGEGRMGGYAWWLNNGKMSKYAPFSIGTDKYKIVVPTWANMTYDWSGGLIVAGQHMYQQTWKVGILDGMTGALKSSYDVPFASLLEKSQTQVSAWFPYEIKAGKTYTITNNTDDNQIVRVSTSIDQPYDSYVINDSNGNMCKHTLLNRGDTYTFTAGADASYILIYQAVNHGTTKTSAFISPSVNTADGVTAMCVYDMPSSSEMRLFIASDATKSIYNVRAKDFTDLRVYPYPIGVNTICGMCFDEWGKLYVACNDNTPVLSKDGNLIYALNPFDNCSVVGSFLVPRKADGGMAIKDGILYTLDNRTATINKISLGGVSLSFNNRVTPYHLPLSNMFDKVAVAISGGAGEANVIYDENMGKFRMWYSRGSIAYTESNDGINWDIPYNVIPNASRSHVFKHNGTWHIYYVLTDNSANKYKIVYHRTSQDGITWGEATQVLTSAQVASACANSVWSDFQQFGSVYVTIENGTWKMLMEGRTDSDYTWSIGYAESTDGTNWTVSGLSPTTINHESFEDGKGKRMIGRTKVFYHDAEKGVYWMTCHFSEFLDIPTRIGLAWSTDLKHINILPSCPLLDFTEIEECDQLADAWMMEHDGKLYLYNSCVRNYSPEHSYIRVATLGMSAKDFVESVAIING